MVHHLGVRALRAAVTAATCVLLGACAGGAASPGPEGDTGTLRLGYFPNVTHATALVGIEQGTFARALGDDVRLETKLFNAGPAAVEALFAGALDAAYIGPNPAINAYARSDGEAIRIVAGATSGGAFLIVRPGIRDAAGLRGAKIASPQLGNTQDVALRAWLRSEGFTTTLQGSGDVSVVPQESAQSLQTFRAGEIDGAWVPEPWASRLVLEAGGRVLVDERDLWPGGRYVTTHLIVRTAFLREHPDLGRRLVRGQVEASGFVNERPDEARRIVAEQIERITGSRLPDDLLARAWESLAFTNDPIAVSLRRSAEQAVDLELLDPVDLAGIYDLGLLNEVLRAAGEPQVVA